MALAAAERVMRSFKDNTIGLVRWILSIFGRAGYKITRESITSGLAGHIVVGGMAAASAVQIWRFFQTIVPAVYLRITGGPSPGQVLAKRFLARLGIKAVVARPLGPFIGYEQVGGKHLDENGREYKCVPKSVTTERRDPITGEIQRLVANFEGRRKVDECIRVLEARVKVPEAVVARFASTLASPERGMVLFGFPDGSEDGPFGEGTVVKGPLGPVLITAGHVKDGISSGGARSPALADEGVTACVYDGARWQDLELGHLVAEDKELDIAAFSVAVDFQPVAVVRRAPAKAYILYTNGSRCFKVVGETDFQKSPHGVAGHFMHYANTEAGCSGTGIRHKGDLVGMHLGGVSVGGRPIANYGVTAGAILGLFASIELAFAPHLALQWSTKSF